LSSQKVNNKKAIDDYLIKENKFINEKHKYQQKIKELEQQLTTNAENQSKNQVKIEDLQQQCTGYSEDQKKDKKTIKELEQQLAKNTEEKKNTEEQQLKTNNGLLAKLKHKDQEVTNLNQEVDKIKNSNDQIIIKTLTTACQTKDNKIESQKAKIDELNKEIEKLTDVQIHSFKVMDEKVVLESELQVLKNKNQRLELEMKECKQQEQSYLQELEEKTNAMSSEKENNALLQNEIKALKQDFELLNEKAELLNLVKTKIKECQSLLNV
jgi:hypothetical protein